MVDQPLRPCTHAPSADMAILSPLDCHTNFKILLNVMKNSGFLLDLHLIFRLILGSLTLYGIWAFYPLIGFIFLFNIFT